MPSGLSGPSRSRAPHQRDLIPGAAVSVRSRFEGSWVRGFEVAEVLDTATGTCFRLRRTSDGAVLPALFGTDEVDREL